MLIKCDNVALINVILISVNLYALKKKQSKETILV